MLVIRTLKYMTLGPTDWTRIDWWMKLHFGFSDSLHEIVTQPPPAGYQMCKHDSSRHCERNGPA
jgi:hypothetical protein